jgi:hypothetical protein
MKRFFRTYCIASLFMSAFLFSCEEDYEPATITFYPSLNAAGVEPDEAAAGLPLTVVLRTSRVLAEESKVNIRIEGNGAGYGNSYTTFPPQLEPGLVTLTVPRGENEVSFTFTPKNDGVFIPTDYQYTFTIDEIDNEIKSIGQKHFNMVVTDNTEAFFFDAFSSCPGTNFTERIASGVSTWGCSGFGYPDEASSNMCREANAFNKGGTGASNTYLVMTTPIDGTQYDFLYISAQVYSRFTGAGGIKFVYSTNYSGTGDPEADGVTWTEFSEINAALPAAGSQDWKGVAQLLENVGDDPVYIAIQHAGGTTGSSSSWRIDDFSIKGN